MQLTPDVLLEKSEREALCDLFAELGPDAPTLCVGWTTSDLAVHLIVCEARPHAWLAIPMGDRVPALDRYFDGMVDKERARGWDGLVDRVRQGPAYGPTKYTAVRERMLFREFLIHHEDVRRANGANEPRTGIPLVQERAWEKVPAFAKRMLAVADGYGLELVHTDGRVDTVKPGPNAVRVVGEPVELLLYVFGRTTVARVEVVDPDEALRVRDTSVLAALPRVRAQ
jgi:uncharacterized protein (TIGR03085 family)